MTRKRAGRTVPATRRRGAELEQAILRAAVDELLAGGFDGLTMDRVAERAGTNKNAIYRRWPNRASLGLAAYRQLTAARFPVPDTGRLRDDVLELLRGANRRFASPEGEILRSLLANAQQDPELLAGLRDSAADGGSDLWLTVLRRAVDRGEATEAALHPRVATVAVVLLRNEFITRGVASVPEAVLAEIVDEVFVPLVRGRATNAPRKAGR